LLARWLTPFRIQLLIWLLLTAAIVTPFFLAATSDLENIESGPGIIAQARLTMLPGMTTHGHYQIELACNACHTADMGVKANACNDCHAEELDLARDTHPISKFTDPSNADRLEKLNVLECSSCHREHVPNQTLAVGVSLPKDYCYHCHQDVMEQRPSHREFAFDSCSNAGCHNYHDNRALYEKFLYQHAGEPDMLEDPHVALLSSTKTEYDSPLKAADQDAPPEHQLPAGDQLLDDWVDSVHAQAQVNCSGCHSNENTPDAKTWTTATSHETCAKCHEYQVAGWLRGRHGMRLQQGLSPMTPGTATHECRCSSPGSRLLVMSRRASLRHAVRGFRGLHQVP
jgi:predicted CXXCH cytochrome family protein